MTVLAERVSLNPPAEDPTVQSLDYCGYDRSWGIYLMAHDYMPPAPEVIHSSSSDTEGDPVVQAKYGNRTIAVKVRVFEPEDPAAENLIQNPSAEVETAGTTGGGVARVVDPTGTPAGLNLDTYFTAATVASGTGATTTAECKIGVTYTYSRYLFVSAKTEAAQVLLRATTNAGATIASTIVAAVIGEWVRLSVTFTAAATEVVKLITGQSGAGTLAFRFTAGQLEVGPAATHYFDGDTPGCDWASTRNASNSTRPAPDGTRFSRICRDVTRQMDKLRRTKKATLRRISAQGGPMYFDLRVGSFTEIPTTLDTTRKRGEYGMTYEATSFGRGPEQLLAEAEETVKPAMSMVVPNVPGETYCLGRLVLTDKQGVNQNLVLTGVEQTTLSQINSAETFYEAEALTALGAAVSPAAATGASGAQAVESPFLIGKQQAILSTKIVASTHLSHVGSFRVWARIKAKTAGGQIPGEITVKLSWSEGDFVSTNSGAENEQVIGTGERETWMAVDLGIVSPQQAVAGTTQRWEGRISAATTGAASSDFILIDCLMLQPITDGAATMASNPTPQNSGVFAGFDNFVQTAGNLAGKVAITGGTWAGAGSANDFATTGALLKRTALSDAASVGRYATLGAAEPLGPISAGVILGCNQLTGTSLRRQGLLLRYTNVENWFMAVIEMEAPLGIDNYYISLRKRVANVTTQVAKIVIENTGLLANFLATLTCAIDSTGLITGTLLTHPTGAAHEQTFTAKDAVLNETGTLKKGKFGLYDEYAAASASERTYDEYEVSTPITDAAIYASRALELRSDRSRRESSDGATWGSVSNQGDYLSIPPSGSEKRPARIFAKGSRNPMADEGIDDLKAQLFGTPQYLHAAPY